MGPKNKQNCYGRAAKETIAIMAKMKPGKNNMASLRSATLFDYCVKIIVILSINSQQKIL